MNIYYYKRTTNKFTMQMAEFQLILDHCLLPVSMNLRCCFLLEAAMIKYNYAFVTVLYILYVVKCTN